MSDWKNRRRQRRLHVEPEEKPKSWVEEAAEITRPVTLHHLHRYFEGCKIDGELRPIKGNEQIRIAFLLNFVICKNGTIVRGESGSAKSEMMKAGVSLVWGESALDGKSSALFVLMPGSKKKAFTKEMEEKIGSATHCFIPEWQNVAEEYEWLIKLWLEGRDAGYDRAMFGGQGYEDFHLPPLPVMTSLAEANEAMPDLSNEMKRRVVSYYTRSDEALNDEVHAMKASHRMLPDEDLVTLSSEDFTSLRARLLCAAGEDRRVINPAADVIRKAIPHKYTTSNTFIDYWFDLIESVTKFYAHDRPSTPRYLFATPGDNYVAHLLAADVMRDLSLGIPPLGNYLLEVLPVGLAWGVLQSDVSDKLKSTEELVDYLDDQGIPRTKKVVQETMDKLVAAGFAKQADDKRYYRTKDINSSPAYVDWSGLVESAKEWVRKKFPAVADEYDGMATGYIHPFTGEEMEIPISAVDEKSKRSEKGGLSNV